MKIRNSSKYFVLAIFAVFFTACVPTVKVAREANKSVPESFVDSKDTINSALIQWRQFFKDPYLNALIDTALSHNQELNITLQEIEIQRNEIRAKKGEYLPSVGIGGAAGVNKPGRYTPQGALEKNIEIIPGEENPEPLQDYQLGAYATWEIDVWGKLHNAKRSAVNRYLSSIEGKNFMITHLVSEIANSYYELLALDNELAITRKNIEIQSNALKIVKQQKEAARVTELAVRRFEAQVLNTKGLQFSIEQNIVEVENRINFLLGRYPQHIERNSDAFIQLVPQQLYAGVPAQLLQNRPDIKEAEYELAAAKLDVKVAKAKFYPSLSISAGVGLQGINPAYFIKTPEALLYSIVGELSAPLINRSGIKAGYLSASARQLQAVYNYEQTILNAYVEVLNQVNMMSNLEKSYDLKLQEVDALNEAVKIANGLFTSARADYMEVLLTQRDALESKFELIETKERQMNAFVNMYKALGGGWTN